MGTKLAVQSIPVWKNISTVLSAKLVAGSGTRVIKAHRLHVTIEVNINIIPECGDYLQFKLPDLFVEHTPGGYPIFSLCKMYCHFPEVSADITIPLITTPPDGKNCFLVAAEKKRKTVFVL